MARPRRLTGFSYIGPYRYFLTFCTEHRHRAFVNDAAVATTLFEFRRSATEFSLALLAYCFMPDHVHLLVEGMAAHSNLAVFVRRAKQRSGRVYASRCDRRLWQEGYFDRVLRPDDDAREVARYIIANPVRAGLVERPREYPHTGSDVWTLDDLCASLD